VIRRAWFALLLGALGACNVRVEPPPHKDDAVVAAETAAAQARLTAVAAAQNHLLDEGDFGAEYRTLAPRDFTELTPNPLEVITSCVFGLPSPRPVTKSGWASLTKSGIDGYVTAPIFARADSGYFANATVVASNTKTAERFADRSGGKGTLPFCVIARLGTEGTGVLDKQNDPNVAVVNFTVNRKLAEETIGFSGRIVILRHDRTVSVILGEQPTSAGAPDPRKLASVLFTRIVTA
jgi:hypothetical protein